MPIHILDAGDFLTAVAGLIAGKVETSSAACGEALGLDLSSVDLVVRHSPRTVIPETGIGGFAPDAHTVFISVDATRADIAPALRRWLPQTVAHELHHVTRWRSPGYGRTLLAALVTEGLAIEFALQMTGAEPPPWASALSDGEAARLRRRARESANEPYDHGSWFFGSHDDFPRWAGYTLGFRLVRGYLREHPSESAATLVHAPAEVFARHL